MTTEKNNEQRHHLRAAHETSKSLCYLSIIINWPEHSDAYFQRNLRDHGDFWLRYGELEQPDGTRLAGSAGSVIKRRVYQRYFYVLFRLVCVPGPMDI